MSAVMITARVRAGREKAFGSWQELYLRRLAEVPGFVGSDMLAPSPGRPEDPWKMTVHFSSAEALAGWQTSPLRTEMLEAAAGFLEGRQLEEQVEDGGRGDVTEIIFSRIRHGMEDRYRQWVSKVQAAQGSYPGYRGMYLQPPASGGGGHWTSIIRYDTVEHLEAWMQSPERAALLKETHDFIEGEELVRLGTAFPGWVPVDPLTGEAPPDWKTAMLVLLGLFPIVMLEMKFLSPILGALGLHASPATFIGNVISVALTSFWTMPLFVRWFGWWLFPRGESRRAVTNRGVAIISGLYALEILVLYPLLPW